MELWYQIVSILPFEWAGPDGLVFMKNALLAVLVISPLFGLLSTMVVTNRMSFFSDALGHSAFTGMAIGAIFGFVDPMWCAVVFAIAFSLLFTLVRHRTHMASDTVIGVFSSTAVALGIFLATLVGRSFTRFNNLLIGDILSVEPGKIGLLALILLLVIALWLASFNQLMLSSIHPALADRRGTLCKRLSCCMGRGRDRIRGRCRRHGRRRRRGGRRAWRLAGGWRFKGSLRSGRRRVVARAPSRPSRRSHRAGAARRPEPRGRRPRGRCPRGPDS